MNKVSVQEYEWVHCENKVEHETNSIAVTLLMQILKNKTILFYYA